MPFRLADNPAAPQPVTPTAARKQTGKRFRIDSYAYSFFRGGGSSGGLAPAAGQYGGGQSGWIATIGPQDPDNPSPPKMALLIRAAVAHSNIRDRELGVGLRWQPLRSLPVTISGERRLRNLGADSFAAYIAGGRSDIALPAAFKLETYAQAGVVSGRDAGMFFDAQARADRPVLPRLSVPLHAGVGVWAGGQSGTARFDIGPSLRTELAVAKARIRITADWRFRVAGNAAPDSGPALTLSTGF